MDNYVGEKLGNYHLSRLLGAGGFAEVYLGEHIYLKTQAAIKVLRISLVDEALDQFLAEARTIAHLDHPNIVRTLEFGVQDSTAYLVMSYAPNGTVLRRYPRGSVVPLPTVVQYVRQIANALQYAHGHGLIHRDVKPENILLGRDEGILLSDFGLAVMSASSQPRKPIDKAGTVSYMAPEQIEGKPSKSSDQYALGVVVYEWLCGSLPFTGLEKEVAAQHLQVPPPPLSERAPSVPSTIERVVMKALAKDPSQRYLSVLHFAQALEEAYRPYKLVRLLRSSSNVHNVETSKASLKRDTYSTAEAEASGGSQPPSVLASDGNDEISSSPQNMPARRSASRSSAQTPRLISRRIILAGLAGLIAVSSISAGAFWTLHDLRFSASSPHSSSSMVRSPGASHTAMNLPASGSSTLPPMPGNYHPTPTPGANTSANTMSVPTTVPTLQATPTASTTSSSYTYKVNAASTPMATPPPPPTPTPTPTLAPTPTPSPTPMPTPPGKGRLTAPGQLKKNQG